MHFDLLDFEETPPLVGLSIIGQSKFLERNVRVILPYTFIAEAKIYKQLHKLLFFLNEEFA